MAEPAIVRAEPGDVRAMARRRMNSQALPLYLTLAEASPAGVWIATDEGTPVGIAFAHALEDEWFLSDLYVEPSFRRAGLAGRLYERALEEGGEGTRSALVDVRESAGLAFLARKGLAAHALVLELAGPIPRAEHLAQMAAGSYQFRAEPLDPLANGFGLDALDRATRGSARRADHAFFTARASGHVFFLGDEMVGYAYVWPDGRIGPLASHSPSYLVPFLAFAMMTLVRNVGASWCTALIPGANLRAARAALGAGLEIVATHAFASDAPAPELARYVGAPRGCF